MTMDLFCSATATDVAETFKNRTINISGKARQGGAQLHRTTHDVDTALADAEMIVIVVPATGLLVAQLIGNQNPIVDPTPFNPDRF